MSYLEQEKAFDRAVIFLSQAVAKEEELPVACVLHSIRVGLSLQQQGYEQDVIIAGILHDVVEDTSVTLAEINASFGTRVAELVEAMTYNDNLAVEERSRDSVDRCKLLGKEALVIKAADIADNLSFYLASASPDRFEVLLQSLDYFLDVSADELNQEISWQAIRHQREVILAKVKAKGRKNDDQPPS